MTRLGTDDQFNDLALALFSLQFELVPAFRKFCHARSATPETVSDWTEIPAIPTAAFKEFELSSLPANERSIVFYSSGTTAHRTSRHFHDAESIKVYEASLLPWFRRHLLAELEDNWAKTAPLHQHNYRFIILTPRPALAPNSSLVHMFETVQRDFGSQDSAFTGVLSSDGGWKLDKDKTWELLLNAQNQNDAVVLLGTAFSFLELLDWMLETHRSLSLPPGTRVLETGGYKGRTRTLPKSELHQMISKALGISPENIVSEYGMSELSSQAYDLVTARDKPEMANRQIKSTKRSFCFPLWAKARIISPETGDQVEEGETGVITVFDLANVRSVMAIQTEDLGIRRGENFELIGRAALAEPRGCSLMVS